MRNGTLTNEKCKFLINRFLSKVNKKNKYMFNDAINLVAQWKDSIYPTIKYLNMLRTPVAKKNSPIFNIYDIKSSKSLFKGI